MRGRRFDRRTLTIAGIVVVLLVAFVLIFGDNIGLYGTAGKKDSDGDGIPDKKDQCPNKPGPKKNGGCPEAAPPPVAAADRDGDGVPDDADQCPNQGDQGYGLNANGCPKPAPAPVDSDGDGIPDSNDACPNQGDQGYGLKGNGCPKEAPPPPPADSDGDGVPDNADQCPNQGDQGYGLNANGCPNPAPPPPDSDGDGVPDSADQCPSQGDQGYGVDANGCPNPAPAVVDTDNDGVPDSADQCPDQGDQGYGVDANGCPNPAPDTDNDTVPDNVDQCPTEPGLPSNNGCPAEQQSAVSPSWDRSSLSVSASCDSSSGIATFTVVNDGDRDMAGPTTWTLYDDGVEIQSGEVGPIPSGGSQQLTFTGVEGKLRLVVNQRPGHPGKGSTQADVDDCLPKQPLPDLALDGVCNAQSGIVTFTVTNNGGAMDSASGWTASDGQSGSLQLGAGESASYNVVVDASGNATFNVADFGLSKTVTDCLPPPAAPSLTLVGQCDMETGTITFTVTNNGGPMDSPAAWSASDGTSGTLQLGAGESNTFTVAGDANGNATFNIPDYSLTKTVEDCAPPPAPPSLELVGQCDMETGTITFTVTNNGGPMDSPAAWDASDGTSGTLQLAAGESNTFTVAGDASGNATFNIPDHSLTKSVEDCAPPPPPPPPALTVTGQCDTASFNVVFTVTNAGGPMTGPTAWDASDGQSGQLGLLDFGESVSFTVAPDANGTATFSIPEFSLTETIDGCVPPPPPICGATTLSPSGFPVIDMNPADCGPTMASGPWTPIEIGGSVCPDWFVYHTNQTGDWEIFRLGDIPGEPGANPNLTQGVGPRIYDISPTRSPDSQWIAFASNRDGNWEIYVGRTDGSFQQRVTYAVEAIDIDPAWSPVGNYVAYESSRDGNWELYMVDVTTGAETRLTDNPASDLNAFWSPDGTKLVFQSDRDGFWQIYQLDIATLKVTKLSDGVGDDLDPQYSNDGQMIAFRSMRDGQNGVIYAMNADGSDVRAISDPNGDALNQAFSPDDSLIAYQSNLDGDSDIYVYRFAGKQTRKVTDNNISDYAPTWFCNAPTVIFTSDITQDSNVFDTSALPINAPPINVETQASQLTNEPKSDQYPQDSPSEENASREGALPRPAKNK